MNGDWIPKLPYAPEHFEGRVYPPKSGPGAEGQEAQPFPSPEGHPYSPIQLNRPPEPPLQIVPHPWEALHQRYVEMYGPFALWPPEMRFPLTEEERRLLGWLEMIFGQLPFIPREWVIAPGPLRGLSDMENLLFGELMSAWRRMVWERMRR